MLYKIDFWFYVLIKFASINLYHIGRQIQWYLIQLILGLLPVQESYAVSFFKKWAIPGLFFGLFKQTVQFLQQIYVKKCPSSIRCRDSNSQPSEREYPPITTRPGLPPSKLWIFYGIPILTATLHLIEKLCSKFMTIWL